MGFTKSVITATDITNTLKAWLRTSAGNETVSAASNGEASREYLLSVAKEFVEIVIDCANRYAKNQGWNDLVDDWLLEWSTGVDGARARIDATNPTTGNSIAHIWLPTATELFGKYSMDIHRRSYKQGVYDVIGLMTQGYERNSLIVRPPVQDTTPKRWPRNPHRSALTVHYLQKPYIWGFNAAWFVDEAKTKFETKYADIGAKVTGLPDTWQ